MTKRKIQKEGQAFPHTDLKLGLIEGNTCRLKKPKCGDTLGRKFGEKKKNNCVNHPPSTR